MKPLPLVGVVLLSCIVGCGGSERAPAPMPKVREAGAKSSTPAVVMPGDLVAGLTMGGTLQPDEFVAQEAAGAQVDPKGGEQRKEPKVARKIKHSADLKLITDEFDKTRDKLQELIEKHQGYEAMADIRSSPGSQRVGTWRVRVPMENFAAFRDAARKLAEVESDTVNTEDLTDQYYDLEANIKNLKAEQDSWRDMLKRTSDKLENLISVKRELDRVTDEIQRKEGRLRLMANLTDLTTVNLSLRERQKFNPDKGPEVAEAATFGMKAGKTFDHSWGALLDFGQGIALFVIALAPWASVTLTPRNVRWKKRSTGSMLRWYRTSRTIKAAAPSTVGLRKSTRLISTTETRNCSKYCTGRSGRVPGRRTIPSSA